MAGKYTESDIKSLAREIIRAKDEFERPFNLLTGAGCSLSGGIPLAGDFVKEINKQFSHQCNKRLNEEERKSYGHCMSVVPKNDRKRLLNKYLYKAQVNWGHLAMAAMMEAGYIGRVLTFNFDSLFARSCGLLGIYPATYDFASGVTSDVHHITDRAIIHLHGQGHGIALLNTEDETERHAENLKPLIRETLNKNPLLVIGYSGQSDAVFPIIKEEYEANEGLVWAGYNDTPNAMIQELLSKGVTV